MRNALLSTALAAALLGALPVAAQPAPPAPATPPTPPAAPVAAERADQVRAAREEMRALQHRMAELARIVALDGERQAVLARPRVGILLGSRDGHATVLGVTPGSPAERGGLRVGDRIVAIDGNLLAGEQAPVDARDRLGRLAAGDPVTLRYLRDGREAEVTLEAEAVPLTREFVIRERIEQMRNDTPPHGAHDVHASPRVQVIVERAQQGAADAHGAQHDVIVHRSDLPFDVELLAPFAHCGGDEPADCRRNLRVIDALRWRGLRLARIDRDLGRYFGTERGALVIAVDREQLQPLRSGDVILEVDDRAVDGPDQVMQALRDVAAGDTVELTVLRERKRRTVAIEAPQASRLPAPPAAPAPPAPPAPPASPVPAPAAPAADAPPAPPARGVLETVLL